MMIRGSQPTTTLTPTRTPRNTIPHKVTLGTSPVLMRTRDTTTQDTLRLRHRKSNNPCALNSSSSREYRPESRVSTRSLAAAHPRQSLSPSWACRCRQDDLLDTV